MEHILIKLWPSKGSGQTRLKGWLVCFLAGFIVWILVDAAGASEEDAGTASVGQLEVRVRSLCEALVSAKMEIDYLRARLERRAYGMADATGLASDSSAMVREKNYLILDVNKELGMVILNGGHQDGVRPGLMFNVMRGDRFMATVRVVDARATIAGAVIQNEGRELPKVQDRAVVAAGSKN